MTAVGMSSPWVVLDGLTLGESPRWHDDRLWLCDWGAQELIALDVEGASEVIARVPSFPFSIDWLPDGTLLIVSSTTLIVAESYGQKLTAFDIGTDGGLSNRGVWADLGGGVPDGICIDAEGAVWFADVPNRRCSRVREGGEVLQEIDLDRGCFACMLGGPDGRTLFMVAAEWGGPDAVAGAARTGRVLAVDAPAPGAGWP